MYSCLLGRCCTCSVLSECLLFAWRGNGSKKWIRKKENVKGIGAGRKTRKKKNIFVEQEHRGFETLEAECSAEIKWRKKEDAFGFGTGRALFPRQFHGDRAFWGILALYSWSFASSWRDGFFWFTCLGLHAGLDAGKKKAPTISWKLENHRTMN